MWLPRLGLLQDLQKIRQIEKNITAFVYHIWPEFSKSSGESSKNTISQCCSNPPTHWDKTGPPQGQNTKTQTKQRRLWHTVPQLYIGETKQPPHKWMAQHRRPLSSGQDSAGHLHLKESGHSFEGGVKFKQPSLNLGWWPKTHPQTTRSSTL